MLIAVHTIWKMCNPDGERLNAVTLYQPDYNDLCVEHPTSSSGDWHHWLRANVARYLLFARSQVRCEADAHDLLQDVLVEVWRRNSHRAPDDALVFKTLRRRAIDLARRQDRRVRREQAAPDWWQPPDEDPSHDAELEKAVLLLPDHLREVVLLKIWGKLTFRQIADALALPQATAASRYRYAIEHLRNTFKEVGS